MSIVIKKPELHDHLWEDSAASFTAYPTTLDGILERLFAQVCSKCGRDYTLEETRCPVPTDSATFKALTDAWNG